MADPAPAQQPAGPEQQAGAASRDLVAALTAAQAALTLALSYNSQSDLMTSATVLDPCDRALKDASQAIGKNKT